MNNRRLLELDSLRGIAAISVLLFHFTMGKPWAAYGFKFGVTGVELFFIISGFVIFLTLSKTDKWHQFLVSRFSRLFPTYWTCVTFTFLLKVVHYKYNIWANLPNYLANLTMFQNYLGFADIDGPYWTMLIEMQFYLIMFLLFIFKWLRKIEFIGLVLVLFILFKNVYIFVHYNTLSVFLDKWFSLFNHFPLFFSGIIFYKIKVAGSNKLQYVLLALCFLVQLNLFTNTSRSAGFINFTEYSIALSIYFIIFLIYINFGINLICNKVCIFLGFISYCLYLIHQYISIEVVIPVSIKYLHLNLFSACLVSLAIVLSLAYLITKFIERPAMLYLRSIFLVRYKK